MINNTYKVQLNFLTNKEMDYMTFFIEEPTLLSAYFKIQKEIEKRLDSNNILREDLRKVTITDTKLDPI